MPSDDPEVNSPQNRPSSGWLSFFVPTGKKKATSKAVTASSKPQDSILPLANTTDVNDPSVATDEETRGTSKSSGVMAGISQVTLLQRLNKPPSIIPDVEGSFKLELRSFL